jgi:hypothetical protein
VLFSYRDFVELSFLVLLVVGSLWSIWRVNWKRAVRRHTRLYLAVLSVAAGAGLCLLPYQPSSTVSFVGFPLPLAIFQLQDGRWVDYVLSPARVILLGVVNVMLVGGVVHALALAFFALRGRLQH